MGKRALFVLAVVAACGDDGPAHHLDGGVTSIDSDLTPMPDASFGPVSLTIQVNGVPRPNIVVHFQNADSSLVATEMTNSTGTATHMMGPGGYVTAIDPYVAPNAYSRLYTFAAVKPGDHLQLFKKGNVNNTAMSIKLPVQDDAAITRYVVTSSCTSDPTTMTSTGSGFQPMSTMVFKVNCTAADILATAFNSANEIVEYFLVSDQTITANGQLNYANKTYSPPTSWTYTFNNTADLSTLEVNQSIYTAKGPVYSLPMTNASTATLTLPTFTGAIEFSHVAAFSLATGALHLFFDWGPLATPFLSDLGARKLVDVTDPVFDNAAQTLAWTEAAGATPDSDYVDIDIQRTTATNNNFGVDWQMVAPHTGASVKFPTLPVGAVDYNADADDIVGFYNVALIKTQGGYDAIRANGFIFERIVDGNEYNDLVSTTPGSVEVVIWQEPLSLHRPASTGRLDVLRHRTRR